MFTLNVFRAVKTTRSVRSYTKKPVEKSKLNKILEAARLSPSAANNQPWSFVVVTDKEVRESLFSAYNRDWFVEAPVIVVACAITENAWSRQDREEYWKVDVSIAMQNMMLVAHELGLGTCWIGAFDEDRVKEALMIPQNIRVLAMTPVGYPTTKEVSARKRKTLEEIVHYQHW